MQPHRQREATALCLFNSNTHLKPHNPGERLGIDLQINAVHKAYALTQYSIMSKAEHNEIVAKKPIQYRHPQCNISLRFIQIEPT